MRVGTRRSPHVSCVPRVCLLIHPVCYTVSAGGADARSCCTAEFIASLLASSSTRTHTHSHSHNFDSSRSVRSYGIENGASLEILLRLRGGMPFGASYGPSEDFTVQKWLWRCGVTVRRWLWRCGVTARRWLWRIWYPPLPSRASDPALNYPDVVVGSAWCGFWLGCLVVVRVDCLSRPNNQ